MTNSTASGIPEPGVGLYAGGAIAAIAGSTLQAIGLQIWKLSHIRAEKAAREAVLKDLAAAKEFELKEKADRAVSGTGREGDAAAQDDDVNGRASPMPVAQTGGHQNGGYPLDETALVPTDHHFVWVPGGGSAKAFQELKSEVQLFHHRRTASRDSERGMTRSGSGQQLNFMTRSASWKQLNSNPDRSPRDSGSVEVHVPQSGGGQVDKPADGVQQKKCCAWPNYFPTPLWCFGFFIFAVGNAGDFIALGITKVSVVTLCGSSSLAVNTLMAKLILDEVVTWLDIWAALLIIAGITMTVVGNNTEPIEWLIEELIKQYYRADVRGLLLGLFAVIGTCFLILYVDWRTRKGIAAKTETPNLLPKVSRFVGSVYCVTGAFIACYTVLFGKAFSSLIVLSITKGNQFHDPLSAMIVGVFLISLPSQLVLINWSLAVNDALYHIPNFYVYWNLGSIVCGAIFYRELNGLSTNQYIIYGAGVVVLIISVIMSNMATSYKVKAQADRQEQDRVTAAAEEGIERGGDRVDRLEAEARSSSRVQIDTEAGSQGGTARAACLESRGGAACLVSRGVQSREPPEHTSHSPSLSDKTDVHDGDKTDPQPIQLEMQHVTFSSMASDFGVLQQVPLSSDYQVGLSAAPTRATWSGQVTEPKEFSPCLTIQDYALRTQPPHGNYRDSHALSLIREVSTSRAERNPMVKYAYSDTSSDLQRSPMSTFSQYTDATPPVIPLDRRSQGPQGGMFLEIPLVPPGNVSARLGHYGVQRGDGGGQPRHDSSSPWSPDLNPYFAQARAESKASSTNAYPTNALPSKTIGWA